MPKRGYDFQIDSFFGIEDIVIIEPQDCEALATHKSVSSRIMTDSVFIAMTVTINLDDEAG